MLENALHNPGRTENFGVRDPKNENPDDDFFEKMQIDKKVKDGKIRFVLLRDIGHATLEDGVDRKDVEIAINNSLP